MDFRNLFPSYWDLEKWTIEIKILNNVVSDTNIQSSSKRYKHTMGAHKFKWALGKGFMIMWEKKKEEAIDS